MIVWNVYDEHGKVRKIKTSGYYIPQSQMRLFSPVSYFRHHQNQGSFSINAIAATLVLANGSVVPLPDYKMSLLPIAHAHLERERGQTQHHQSAFPRFNVPTTPASLADPMNSNVTAEEKELLTIHWRLGHPGFQLIQKLIQQKCIHTRLSGAGKCRPPTCSACLLAKMTRKGADVSHEVKDPKKEMSLKRDDLKPGDCVSIDQYESRIRGRLPTSRGNEPAHTRYCGGTIFADHASGYLSVQHQVTLGGSDTVRSKRAFAQECREYQVGVERYHGDNGVFKPEVFIESLESKGQTIDFSGTGAHHQNGVAKRSVKTATERARTLMVHAAIHWPEQGHSAKCLISESWLFQGNCFAIFMKFRYLGFLLSALGKCLKYCLILHSNGNGTF
jgi:hypothetical protein